MFRLYKQSLCENADFCRLEKNIRDGVTPISVFGVSDGQKTHIATSLAENRPLLFIAQGAASAEKIKNDYEFYSGKKAVILHGRDQMLTAQFQSDEQQISRIETLNSVLGGADAVIAECDAVLFNLMPPQKLKELKITVEKGKHYDISELTEKLVRCGYTPASQLCGKGEFFVHGGILDVFPKNADNPVRIDFFDDEVDTMRTVDPVSQRSVDHISKIEILPTKEVCSDREGCARAAELLSEELVRFNRICRNRESVTKATDTFAPLAEKLKNGIYPNQSEQLMPYFYPGYTCILDYMPQNTLVVVDEIKVLREHSDNIEREFSATVTNLTEEGKALGRHANVFTGFGRFWKRVLEYQVVSMQTITGTIPDVDAKAIFRFDGRAIQSFHGKPEFLIQEVKMYQNAGYRVVLCAGTQARLERLEKEFTEANIAVIPLKRTDVVIEAGQIVIVPGTVTRGYEYSLMKLAVIGENDIFTLVKQNRTSNIKSSKKGIDTFVDLKIGDAVVHETNGIGIYQGIVQIETDGAKKDYLFLKYRDDDKLYVPVEQMNRVQKYVAPDDTVPRLSKLGTQEWSNTKAKVRKSIADMTDKLLALYRVRESSVGISFLPDTPWQRDFEEDFQYEETPDQLRCIAEIKADMESDKVMDRLLCGDVGYGKTEVALRAVFKAVMSGKQAAILAPTTILVQQHYNTLKTRMVNFQAVRIEMLSRFRTPKEQKKIIADLAEGKVDILVGTHKMLAKDVKFKELGLLVVDEEQRFGVAHKEKIKELKTNIDVLTLSATPIPRTLNMALSGIRDMSLLETPPQERYPVQTYVIEYSEALIRDAITRELQRNGQVYYLYNRVQGIEYFAEHLQGLVPDARIAIAHGQMDEKQLEKIVLDFYNGEYDVLLCTTIIENGVDIPAANTIIVQDAQRLGLAQLYQLRGRVGRSNRMAYAYFTVPQSRSIGEDAVKRLKAIEEFTQMGSGFKIAMRDLEIRGAGNLLGGEQHGHMAKIGYDLYCKMIKEAVDSSMGKKNEEVPRAKVEIKLDAFISDEYIPNESVKFAIYRKISDISDKDGMLDIRDELRDRFGALPQTVDNLLNIAYIRSIAGAAGVSVIREDAGNTVLMFPDPDLGNVSKAIEGKDCVVSAGKVFCVILKTRGFDDSRRIELIREFAEALAE